MDFLDRLEENEERYRSMRRREPNRIAEPNPRHDITIIGVIRGVDGWYRAGFDENTKTIVPIELIEKALISESAQKMQKSELTESEVSE